MTGKILMVLLLGFTLSAASQEAAKVVKPKLSIEEARTIALAHRKGKIKEEQLEGFGRRAVYIFDIDDKKGSKTVQVDANTGRVLKDLPAVKAKGNRARQKQTMK